MTTKKTQPAKKKLDLSSLRSKSNLRTFEADADKDKILMLHPDEIEAPKQVRTRFRKIQELRDTFDAEGQQSPVIVGPKKANGKYELLKGGRRRMAALIEPVMMLKAIVDTKDYSDIPHEKTLSQLVENIGRDDLLPHEIGIGYLQAKEEAAKRGVRLTNAMIGKRTGQSESYVSQHIALASIPDSLTALIEDGITKDIDLLNSLRVLSSSDPVKYDDFIRRAIAGESIERAEVREANRAAKGLTSSPISGEEAVGDKPVGEGGINELDGSVSQDEPASGPVAREPEHSHANVPDTAAVTESQGNDLSARSKKASKKWQDIDPSDLLIFVSISNDRDVESGTLITNRISTDPDKAWVSVMSDKGPAQVKQVPVDSIQVVSISAK